MGARLTIKNEANRVGASFNYDFTTSKLHRISKSWERHTEPKPASEWQLVPWTVNGKLVNPGARQLANSVGASSARRRYLKLIEEKRRARREEDVRALVY